MNTQSIMDIATKDVITITDDESVKDAIDKMCRFNHRDVIVLSNRHKKFGILSSVDLIKMKKSGVDFNQKISTVLYPTIETINKKSSLLDAINNISSHNYPMCVVDDDNQLVGFVSYYNIISSVDPNIMLERRYVGEFVIGAELKKASQETPLCDVISLMHDTIYDCVILTDENNKSVGIITTKDVIRFFNEGVDFDQKASVYMVSPILTVSYDTSIKDALEFIQDKQFKRLIITNIDGDTIGQITQDELLARIYSKWADIMRNSHDKLEEVNKVLNEKALQYEMMSVTDRLTGIYNRGKFEMELNSEIQRVNRYQSEPFSLVFFDIDNFKKINDTFGHPVGDMVLQKIAKVVHGALRTTDTLARWGGEEFVIIMPHTTVTNAAEAAEKLRQIMEKEQINSVGNVTCSFGVTEFSGDDNIQSIIIRADNAMYKAKKEGKNRVIVA